MQEQNLASIVHITKADAVNAVKVQGKVKHYNIAYIFPKVDAKTFELLETVWPFGNINARADGSISVEYLVKPEEIGLFSSKILSLEIKKENNTVESTIILRYPNGVPEGLKHKILGIIRGSDRVIWGKDEIIILLNNCKDVEAVKRRINDLLSTPTVDTKTVLTSR